jgi:hypothetical protein
VSLDFYSYINMNMVAKLAEKSKIVCSDKVDKFLLTHLSYSVVCRFPKI